MYWQYLLDEVCERKRKFLQKLIVFKMSLSFGENIQASLLVNHDVIDGYISGPGPDSPTPESLEQEQSSANKRDFDAFKAEEMDLPSFKPVFEPDASNSNQKLYLFLERFQMTDYDLSQHGYPNITDYCKFKQSSKVSGHSIKHKTEPGSPKEFRVLSVDCEFVETVMGKALARISLISGEYQVVYDQLVKPRFRITNYLTQFSGITKTLLAKNPTKTLDEVHQDLEQLMDKRTILVGHSLENDFICMRTVHEKVVDTSVLFLFPDGRKGSLKHLVKRYLGFEIQLNAHSSVEDALFTLLLAHKYCEFTSKNALPESKGDSLLDRIRKNKIRVKVAEPLSRQQIISSLEKNDNIQGTTSQVQTKENEKAVKQEIPGNKETCELVKEGPIEEGEDDSYFQGNMQRFLSAGVFYEEYKKDESLRNKILKNLDPKSDFDLAFFKKYFSDLENLENFLREIRGKIESFSENENNQTHLLVLCNKSRDKEDYQMCSIHLL